MPEGSVFHRCLGWGLAYARSRSLLMPEAGHYLCPKSVTTYASDFASRGCSKIFLAMQQKSFFAMPH